MVDPGALEQAFAAINEARAAWQSDDEIQRQSVKEGIQDFSINTIGYLLSEAERALYPGPGQRYFKAAIDLANGEIITGKNRKLLS